MKIQIDKISNSFCTERNIELSVLRLDLIQELGGGNKYFKLKYNLEAARKQNKKSLLTFGGAYSNHIAATAQAGKENGFHTIGIIRGEKQLELNPTLAFSTACGMELYYISREEYRLKDSYAFLNTLNEQFNDFYLIPEGGSNELAVRGCSEILENEVPFFDCVCCACGTGATLAGLICSLKKHQKAIGFSSLKGGEFLERTVQELLFQSSTNSANPNTAGANWNINTNYHFGGYGKTNNALFSFAEDFFVTQNIELDFVYTAKMFYGIFDLISTNYFEEGSKILALHTGGLQGNEGFKK